MRAKQNSVAAMRRRLRCVRATTARGFHRLLPVLLVLSRRCSRIAWRPVHSPEVHDWMPPQLYSRSRSPPRLLAREIASEPEYAAASSSVCLRTRSRSGCRTSSTARSRRRGASTHSPTAASPPPRRPGAKTRCRNSSRTTLWMSTERECESAHRCTSLVRTRTVPWSVHGVSSASHGGDHPSETALELDDAMLRGDGTGALRHVQSHAIVSTQRHSRLTSAGVRCGTATAHRCERTRDDAVTAFKVAPVSALAAKLV